MHYDRLDRGEFVRDMVGKYLLHLKAADVRVPTVYSACIRHDGFIKETEGFLPLESIFTFLFFSKVKGCHNHSVQ